MAHPTDYASQIDISRLRKSPSQMNISSHSQAIRESKFSNANTLVYNFLRENPNWAIDSLVSYCLSQYSDFGVTKEIISDQIKIYILEK